MKQPFNTLIVFLCGLLLAACTLGRNDQPNWQLQDAEVIAGSEHLVITLQTASAAQIELASAHIEETYAVQVVAEWPLAALDVHCLVVETTHGEDVPRLIESMQADEVVRTVQVMNTFATSAESDELAGNYDDDLFELQTGLHQINAPRVHPSSTGRDVKVGIIDTAVDLGHPDLRDRDVLSRDFVSADSDGEHAEVHGTAVAGIIGGDATNGSGIVGVAPDAELLSLRGCWQEAGQSGGVCSTFSLARALNFAVLNDVDIVNMSLAGPYDPLLAELIERGLAQGLIVVAASGSGDDGGFPASQAGVIAVTTAAPEADLETVPAPGIDVLSTAPGRSYDFFSGSSVAAAHISGIAALLRQQEPDLEPPELQAILLATVRTRSAVGSSATPDACLAFQELLNGSIPPACI